MADFEQAPLTSFRSTVFGGNVVVEVFGDRIQFGKPRTKMSTGQRAALGAATAGTSVVFTGLVKKDSEMTIVPLEIIDSIEVIARSTKDKAKHLSNTGVFPGRGNWTSSSLVLAFAGHSLDIPVDSNQADLICTLIRDASASRKQQLRSSEQSPSGVSEMVEVSGASGIADELKKLHDLLQMGALTEQEFNTQKSRILGT
jgi:hypothetical protein